MNVEAENRQAPHDTDREERPAPPRRRWLGIVPLVVLAVIGLGAYGHWRTAADAEETRRDTADFVPTIRTIAAKRLDTPTETTLPGQTEAFDTANLYSRATGYVGRRLVDIGSRVKKDDLLVQIASPDLDRQLDQGKAQLEQVKAALLQAQAQVGQAEANLQLGNVTLNRTDALTQRGYATVQNRDNQQANVTTQQAGLDSAKAGVKVAEANVQAQQATVDRLSTLGAFEQVRAPFDGVVTARNVDVGDLVNADAGSGAPMFTIMRDNILRVSIHVPQAVAVGVRDGLTANVHVAEIPNRTFEGKVARNSGALLSASRTLTVEIDIDNVEHALRPGQFVQVSLAIPRPHPSVEVPAEALVFDQKGLQVAVVEPDNHVRLQRVTIGRDTGKTVEVDQGLEGGEEVALNLPAGTADRAAVKVAPKEAEKTAEK